MISEKTPINSEWAHKTCKGCIIKVTDVPPQMVPGVKNNGFSEDAIFTERIEDLDPERVGLRESWRPAYFDETFEPISDSCENITRVLAVVEET